ncbi:MAG: hypothetical protein V4596_03780 [Bdellovibrionota bacterium]
MNLKFLVFATTLLFSCFALSGNEGNGSGGLPICGDINVYLQLDSDAPAECPESEVQAQYTLKLCMYGQSEITRNTGPAQNLLKNNTTWIAQNIINFDQQSKEEDSLEINLKINRFMYKKKFNLAENEIMYCSGKIQRL